MFVGEHEEGGAQQTLKEIDRHYDSFANRADIDSSCSRDYLFLQQLVQLLLAVVESPLVRAVHDPNEAVCRLEVVAPVGAQGLLTADVPNVQVESECGRERESEKKIKNAPARSDDKWTMFA